MYDYIKGEVAELTPTTAVIEAAGVGYSINISLQTYSAIEKAAAAKLYVHYYVVREDAPVLYGFADRRERDLFRMLIGVSGVGGNTARMILSAFAPDELAGFIATDNAAALKSVKGLGLKTSQKIIVELRDKIGGQAWASTGERVVVPAGGVFEEALAALTMLGFPRAASEKVLREVAKADPAASVEDMVRASLKKL